MPFDIVFNNIPAGYAMNAAQEGEKVKVSSIGFFSSEDGDEFITRLEGFPQDIISMIPSENPILPSSVNKLLAIIRKDKTSTVYLNDEVKLVSEIRIKPKKEGVKEGEWITIDDILDMEKFTFQDITIPKDAGVIFVFSVGWRKGFFYDIAPIHEGMKEREYDIEEVLKGYYLYLLFQNRFKINEETWGNLFNQKWFPFAYLSDGLIKEIIVYAKHKWDIDKLVPKISDYVKDILRNNSVFNKSNPFLAEHIDLIDKAIDRYLNNDYISSIAILYPRIEGVMRSLHKIGGYSEKPSSKFLTKKVIETFQANHTTLSTLLPEKFQKYLDDIYFAHFTPGSSPDVSRHSVAHGEARVDDFSLKSSTIGFLILLQLSLFLKGE